MEDFLAPEHFDIAVQATLSVASTTSLPAVNDGDFANLSIALKSGYSVTNLASIKKCLAICNYDMKKEDEAKSCNSKQ